MSTPVGLAATWRISPPSVSPDSSFSSPQTRHEIGAQSERGAQSLGRGHGLVRRLAVDVKDSSEGEDKIGKFF